MRRLWTLLLVTGLMAPTLQAFATSNGTPAATEQSDDTPKKDKGKKKKKMSKKDMSAALDDLKSTIADLENDKTSLQNDLAAAEAELDELKGELEATKGELEEIKESPASLLTATDEGLTFRLQIGAYNTIDLARYFADPKLITAEEVNGLNKYMIGYFDSFEIAKQVENALRKAGIKDAWVVPYNNGSRISDEEAEGLLGKPIRDKK